MACSIYAQPNNPYDKKGIEYIQSFDLIVKDYNEGKIKELNEEVLHYYSKVVPLQNSISMELASDIVKVFKKQPVHVEDLLNESKLSDYSKNVLTEFINPKESDREAFLSFLIKKNEEILEIDIPSEEKELLLTLSAIYYNSSAMEKNASKKGDCGVQTEHGTTGVSNGTCILLAASIGAVVGFPVCGGLCALGGAILFGVITAIVLS
jgi:hypothetical protein